jgi:hypothetical protein
MQMYKQVNKEVLTLEKRGEKFLMRREHPTHWTNTV